MATKMIGFTYKPKIEGVRVGSIRQTIRLGRRIDLNDKLILFAWSGKPYRSPWAWRLYEVANEVVPVKIYQWGIISLHPYFLLNNMGGLSTPWDHPRMDELAKLDGIDPPTGKELGRLLLSMHKIGPEGEEAQIIRW